MLKNPNILKDPMKINFQEEPFKSIKNIKAMDVLDFHSVLLNKQENEIQIKRL